MGPLGVQEMIAIFLVALILFGPKKLPELGRTLGKALSEFRRAKNEFKASLETHLSELEREARISDSQSSKVVPDYSSPRYPHPYEDYGGSTYDAMYTHEDATPPAQITAPAPDPVADTVPRSNGSHPAEPVPVPTEQDRTV
jgi:sec-independent protein translocase protein TatA